MEENLKQKKRTFSFSSLRKKKVNKEEEEHPKKNVNHGDLFQNSSNEEKKKLSFLKRKKEKNTKHESNENEVEKKIKKEKKHKKEKSRIEESTALPSLPSSPIIDKTRDDRKEDSIIKSPSSKNISESPNEKKKEIALHNSNVMKLLRDNRNKVPSLQRQSSKESIYIYFFKKKQNLILFFNKIQVSIKKVIMLSGFKEHELKQRLKLQIKALGGKVISSENLDPRVTHLVSPSSSMTLKVVCANLGGIWIVSPDWIEQSILTKMWLPETKFGSNKRCTFLHAKKIFLASSFLREHRDESKSHSKIEDCKTLLAFGRAQMVEDISQADYILIGSHNKANQNQRNAYTWTQFLEHVSKKIEIRQEKAKYHPQKLELISSPSPKKSHKEKRLIQDPSPKYPTKFEETGEEVSSPSKGNRSKSMNNIKAKWEKLQIEENLEKKRPEESQKKLSSIKSPFLQSEKISQPKKSKLIEMSDANSPRRLEDDVKNRPKEKTIGETARTKSSSNIKTIWEERIKQENNSKTFQKANPPELAKIYSFEIEKKQELKNKIPARSKSSSNIKSIWEERIKQEPAEKMKKAPLRDVPSKKAPVEFSRKSSSNVPSKWEENIMVSPNANSTSKSSKPLKQNSNLNSPIIEKSSSPNKPNSLEGNWEKKLEVIEDEEEMEDEEEEEEEEEEEVEITPLEQKKNLLETRKANIAKLQKRFLFENNQEVLEKLKILEAYNKEIEKNLEDENSSATKQTVEEFIQEYELKLKGTLKN